MSAFSIVTLDSSARADDALESLLKLAVPGEAELHLLCVHPEYRRNGIGSALLNAAIDAARRAGAKRMILGTQPSMTVAQLLYRSHGFAQVPTLDFVRGDRTFEVFAREI
jgi:ribosomal protein S18 acetylase RimI-like enzyme